MNDDFEKQTNEITKEETNEQTAQELVELEPKKKEDVQQEIKEEVKEEIKKYEVSKKKSGIGKILSRIIWTVLFLFILFETVIGILDMTRLNNNQEPVWYFDSKTEKTNNKTETTYNLGLYVIVQTTERNEKRIVLKPFFLK